MTANVIFEHRARGHGSDHAPPHNRKIKLQSNNATPVPFSYRVAIRWFNPAFTTPAYVSVSQLNRIFAVATPRTPGQRIRSPFCLGGNRQ